MVREVLAQLEHAPRELRAAAAAELLAVTPRTIRNWVHAGVLPGRRDHSGHFYVTVDALEPAIRQRQVLPVDPADGATTVSDEVIDSEIEAVRTGRRAHADGSR